MSVCVPASLCVHVCVCTFQYISVCICVCVYVCVLCLCFCVHVCVSECVHARAYVCVLLCQCVFQCVFVGVTLERLVWLGTAVRGSPFTGTLHRGQCLLKRMDSWRQIRQNLPSARTHIERERERERN